MEIAIDCLEKEINLLSKKKDSIVMDYPEKHKLESLILEEKINKLQKAIKVLNIYSLLKDLNT